MTQSCIKYRTITLEDYHQVIALGTLVHGKGYIDHHNLSQWVKQGLHNNINTGFVAYDNDKLVGFRLTFSANNWNIDQWCSPQLWPIAKEQVCYFKCNTVDEHYRGYGIGSQLLSLSIQAAKQQGARAGVSHLWMQSPGNSAVKYFTKCGGQLIKAHPDKWNALSKDGYICPICHDDCHCPAAEMMIVF